MTPRTLLCAVLFAVGLLVHGQADAAGDVVIERFGSVADGVAPFTSLVIGSNGNLYGAAAQGGQYGQGVVYEVSPPTATVATWTQTPIYSFPPSKEISQPQGALVKGPKGVLYGTTALIGSSNECTVFQLTPPATGSTNWTETDLYRFSGSICSGPIIGGAGGALYGTLTLYAGQNVVTGGGAIFELKPPASASAAWTMTTIYTLSSCFGYPADQLAGTLAAGPGGVLYATTATCPQEPTTDFGTVFELIPPTSGQSTWTTSVIYTFPYYNYPWSLTLGGNGVLYGTTTNNSVDGPSMYALTPPASGPGTWTLAWIDGSLTTSISGGLGVRPLPGAGGSVYGTTITDGAYGFGTLFRLSPPAAGQTQWRLTTLYNFAGFDDGWVKNTLIKGPGNMFYGVAAAGGAFANGTVFSLAPAGAAKSGWIQTTLCSFPGVAAEVPNTALVGDGTGALYGMTGAGGNDTTDGRVFKLTPPATGQISWGYQEIYRFYDEIVSGSNPDVGLPQPPMIRGQDGALYGSISTGGYDVFKLTPPAPGATSWTETTISYLSQGNPYYGPSPITSLIQAPSGTLYVASAMPPFAPTVFSLVPPTSDGSAWKTNVIFYCDETCGDNLFLTIGEDGNLFAISNLIEYPHQKFNGTIFELKPAPPGNGVSWKKTTLYNFTGTANGSQPNGPLLAGPGGVFYGTTLYGGTGGFGTVFVFTPPASGQTAWTESVLYSFGGGLDGSAPQSNLLLGKDGALFGITSLGGETVSSNGGSYDSGTVYKLTPPTTAGGAWSHKILHRFTGGPDGIGPIAGLMLNKDGKLYGTTAAGGGYGSVSMGGYPFCSSAECYLPGTGTVFQVTP